MDNESMEERKRFINSLSDVPPPAFRVGRYTFKATQWTRNLFETNRVVGTELIIRVSVSKRLCILEAILGSERSGRYKAWRIWNAHIWKDRKGIPKWGEGADGAGEFKKERQEDVKTEYCRVCQTLQHQVRLWVVYNAAIWGTFLIQQEKVDTHFLVFPFWRHVCTFYIHYFFLCYH